MENKFMKFFNENKWFVVFYLIWSFIHLILYFVSDSKNEGFWPFAKYSWLGESIIDTYGFLELFVYLTLPLLIFIIIKFVGKDIKKAIDENK